MNQLIIKRASIFSLILGAIIGLIALIPTLIALCMFVVLPFLASIIVILFMKKNDKHLGILTNEQGAILGGIIGFCATLGHFLTFSCMVCILRMIFRNYYAYTIPDMLNQALWLFFVVVFMVALIYAMTNAVSAMGLTWVLNFVEKKPENSDAPLDIEINN